MREFGVFRVGEETENMQFDLGKDSSMSNVYFVDIKTFLIIIVVSCDKKFSSFHFNKENYYYQSIITLLSHQMPFDQRSF